MSITQQIRHLIEQSGKSQYQIAKDAGMRATTLNNAVNAESWGKQIETAENILNALGYELTIKKKPG